LKEKLHEVNKKQQEMSWAIRKTFIVVREARE